MSPTDDDELIPTERVGLVVYQLCLGRRLHIPDVQALTGLSQRGAYDIMYRLSRVLPLYCDAGEWLLNQGEGEP